MSCGVICKRDVDNINNKIKRNIMLEALEMWTERRSNEDEKQTLIDTIYKEKEIADDRTHVKTW